jgi:hypothetical protein
MCVEWVLFYSFELLILVIICKYNRMAKNIVQSFLIVVLFQLIISDAIAQESTLWMRNGKKVTISSYAVDTKDYYEGKISFIDAKGRAKSKYLEDVFSVIDNTGSETIFYTPNFEYGEVLTPEEMKQYTLGMSDARNTSISPMVIIGGVAIGMGAAFIPQPEISLGGNSMGVPVGILAPTLYVGIIGATPPNEDELQQQFPDKANNEHYLMGYQEGVKKKRLKKSLLGAGIGFISGIIVLSATN